MIIKKLILDNFGLYGSRTVYDFTPSVLEGKNISIVRGQNGVGKSTIFEAIQLCLHGSLSLGPRVAATEYDKYLLSRAHQRKDDNFLIAETRIELHLEYVKFGSKIKYKIVRLWSNDQKDPDERLFVYEDDKELSELNIKEKNIFLRELVQPGFAKVMFFDGERLQSLYEDDALNAFMAETCKTMFGLNFIELLDKDIDSYIQKLESGQKEANNDEQIESLQKDIKELEKQKVEIEEYIDKLSKETSSIKGAIENLELEISNQGRGLSDKLDSLKKRITQIESAINTDKKKLVDIYTALGPFTISKKWCIQLRQRIHHESEIEKWQYSQDILKGKLKEINAHLSNDQFWKANSIKLNDENRKHLLDEIKKILLDKPTGEKIIHPFTEAQRTQVLGYIDLILNDLTDQIKKTTDSITRHEEELKRYNEEKSAFSKQESIKPLVDELQQRNQALGAKEREKQIFNNRLENIKSKISFNRARLNAAVDKAHENTGVGDKLGLANKTKSALREYSERLLVKKLELLEFKMIEKFNTLCRKHDYFDRAEIDRSSFNVTLFKGKRIVEQKHLSAGEKQLLIISMFWSLHELSNVNLPMIIDTPLARLDNEHRSSMINTFFPSVLPQLILIGTDMELDESAMNQLAPRIASSYYLSYNIEEHSTVVHKKETSLFERVMV